jgi:hypothetical protein
MAILNTGKSFASGEQLTADKLNQMITDATFNVGGAVDNATLTVNSGGSLAVNQITSSNIPNNSITTSDLAQLGNNQFLGRTSSGTGDVESVDISTIANLVRPKFVQLSNSTTNIEQTKTSNTTVTYTLSDFTATNSESDFDYRKLTHIIIEGLSNYGGTMAGANAVTATLPNGVNMIIARSSPNSTDINSTGNVGASFMMPLISPITNTTSFTISYVAEGGFAQRSVIMGGMYMPNLPIS